MKHILYIQFFFIIKKRLKDSGVFRWMDDKIKRANMDENLF